MNYEQILLLLTVVVGLSPVAAFVWRQNERDIVSIRKACDEKK